MAWKQVRHVLRSVSSATVNMYSLSTRHYSLEVLQNPIRARMCGFGDKVRPIIYLLAFL